MLIELLVKKLMVKIKKLNIVFLMIIHVLEIINIIYQHLIESNVQFHVSITFKNMKKMKRNNIEMFVLLMKMVILLIVVMMIIHI